MKLSKAQEALLSGAKDGRIDLWDKGVRFGTVRALRRAGMIVEISQSPWDFGIYAITPIGRKYLEEHEEGAWTTIGGSGRHCQKS